MTEYNFDIELTSSCNAKCIFCPHDKVLRKRGAMEEILVDKIIEEISAMNKRADVKVGFVGMGEPLLKVNLLRKAVYRFHQESIPMIVVTNGERLKDEALTDVMEKIHGMRMSFTGYDKQSYEAIQGLDYETIMKNITYAQQKIPGKITIQCVLLPEIRKRRQEIEAFWKQMEIGVSFVPFHTRGGFLTDLVVDKEKKVRSRNFPCNIFRLINFISSDGLVLSCCHDIQQENIMGDCRKMTLEQILAKKESWAASNPQGFRICQHCMDWSFD